VNEGKNWHSAKLMQKVFSLCSIGIFLALMPPALVHAEEVDAPLNQIFNGSIAVPGEVDRYRVQGDAGQRMTVSAYWSGLGSAARLRLIAPDGTTLQAPSPEEKRKRVCGGYCYDVSYYVGAIDDVLLPESGMYIVEVAHASTNGVGGYAMGISDPSPVEHVLLRTESVADSFAIRGASQSWTFDAISHEPVALSYAGEFGITSWRITNADGDMVANGSGGNPARIFFTPEETGRFTVIFAGGLQPISEIADMGTSVYQLTPALPAHLNTVLQKTTSIRKEVDLYSFTGEAGRPVTIATYLGHNRGFGLGDGGRLRLLAADGTELAAPENMSIPFRLFVGFYLDALHISAAIDAFPLPETGTYFVEISASGSPNSYWLSVSDPATSFADLAYREESEGIFAVRGDMQEWQFSSGAGQTLGWRYEGEEPMDGWRMTGPDGAEVASGGGGKNVPIVFTAEKSGMHQLVFDGARPGIRGPDFLGPFAYTLIPDAGNEEPVLIDPLLIKHAPILHIFADDFRPKEVASMIEESGLLLSQFGFDATLAEKGTVTESLLASENREQAYLDMENADPGFISVNVPAISRFDKYRTVVYGRKTRDTATANNIYDLPLLISGKEYVVLQYWFFYPFNNWIQPDGRTLNNHEGDWEMIQIILDPELETPLYTTYSWHYNGTTHEWPNGTNGSLLVVEEGHPHVYVAKGGHGSWMSPGTQEVESGMEGKFAKDITPTNQQSITLSKNLCSLDDAPCEQYEILSPFSGNESDTDEWNNFAGRWGEIENPPIEQTKGPRSPKFISYGKASENFSPITRWYEPILWSNSPSSAGIAFLANSPVNMIITNREGQIVQQSFNGEIVSGIPHTYMFSPSVDGPEYAIILTQEEMTLRLEGTAAGTMDLFISSFGPPSENNISTKFLNVPLTKSFIGTIMIGGNNAGTVMALDLNADETTDGFYFEGDKLTLSDIISSLPDEEFTKKNRRTPLFNKAKAVEGLIGSHEFAEALEKLTNDLERHIRSWLIGSSKKLELLSFVEQLKELLSKI
jgi:hypothetical protein